jgi:hypothetical protein
VKRSAAHKDADEPGMTQPQDAAVEFSLIRGDALFRAQRAVGLIPAQGLGVVRRAILAVLITWVPLVVAAAIANRLWPGEVAEPLLQHFGIHVRFLLAVPLFIIDDAVANWVVGEIMPYFVHSGLVTDAERQRFVAIVRRATAWRDGWRPWVAIAGIAIAWMAASPVMWDAHEMSWATSDPPLLALRFGVFWFRYVARPIFLTLLLVWLWRLVLTTALMWRISHLDLALVPTHPDEAAGLGFLEVLPMAFVAPAFAISAVLSGRWAHDVIYHAVPLKTLVIPMGAFVVVTALLLLVPLLVFMRPLWATRRRALFDYGALVGEHHRRLRRRWILGEELGDDAMLEAPELGPGAYSGRLYDFVWRVLPIPVGKRILLAIMGLIMLPMLPLIAIEVHLGDALMKVVRMILL